MFGGQAVNDYLGWIGIVLIVIILRPYEFLNPIRDYYVFQSAFYKRKADLYREDKPENTVEHGFGSFSAAKAFFDYYERNHLYGHNRYGQEAEYSLFMTSSRSKHAAIAYVRKHSMFPDSVKLLDRTPYAKLNEFRVEWREELKAINGQV